MKVAKLQGASLDLWVARAEGKCHSQSPGVWGLACINELGRLSITKNSWDCARYFEPSTNWAHGGPIIQREKIALYALDDADWRAGYDLSPGDGPGIYMDHGHWASDPLVAAMRAYVTSRFGEEVPD